MTTATTTCLVIWPDCCPWCGKQHRHPPRTLTCRSYLTGSIGLKEREEKKRHRKEQEEGSGSTLWCAGVHARVVRCTLRDVRCACVCFHGWFGCLVVQVSFSRSFAREPDRRAGLLTLVCFTSRNRHPRSMIEPRPEREAVITYQVCMQHANHVSIQFMQEAVVH